MFIIAILILSVQSVVIYTVLCTYTVNRQQIILIALIAVAEWLSHRKARYQMQIVIDIPEEEYRCVQITGCIGNKTCISNAIYNGTSLPKGHGRLIDADELKKIIQENDVLSMTGFSVRLCDINSVPTIIEADKAESEEQE